MGCDISSATYCESLFFFSVVHLVSDGRKTAETIESQTHSVLLYAELPNCAEEQREAAKMNMLDEVAAEAARMAEALSRAAAVAALLAVKSVRPLEKDQAVLSQDHRRELPFGSTICSCQEGWNSRAGSQTTNNVGTKDSRTRRCRISSMTCTRWYLRHSKKVRGLGEQTRTEQGTWPTKSRSVCGSTMKPTC